MALDDSLYPVNLAVRGRRCLVVGGGAVAARKVAGLLVAGAEVRVVAPEVCDALQDLADDPGLAVTVAHRCYEPGDLAGAWLALTATGDPAVNAAVRADADRARVWVNAADDPASCTFTLPAVIRRGPVLVTASTSGRSPALASWLADRLGDVAVPELATLAELLGEARAELQAAGRSTEAVDWRPALNSDMLDLLRRGDLARARKRLEACLSSSSD